jgi:membrane associated rhomboid family serine protease
LDNGAESEYPGGGDVLILMTILAFVAIRQMDRRRSASNLDTFKDVAVALTVSVITAYAIDAYGSLAVAGSIGGSLVAIAAFVFLFREDAKKMALKKAGKS